MWVSNWVKACKCSRIRVWWDFILRGEAWVMSQQLLGAALGLPVGSQPRLPRWLSGRESACQCKRRRFDPWVGKIPWRRKWQPFQYSCLENPMDRATWQGCRSMGLQRVRHDLPTEQQPPSPTTHEWERGLAGIERSSRPSPLYSSLKLLSQFSSEWESIPKYVVKICSENV